MYDMLFLGLLLDAPATFQALPQPLGRRRAVPVRSVLLRDCQFASVFTPFPAARLSTQMSGVQLPSDQWQCCSGPLLYGLPAGHGGQN